MRLVIELYKLDHGGRVPPNMFILYDYLSLTGDDQWSEPPVVNVSQASTAVAGFADVGKPEGKRVEIKKPK